MMKYYAVSGGLSVAAQISSTDLPALLQAGFKSVICNRPDGESPVQPDFVEIAGLAGELGIQCRYMPVTPDSVCSAKGQEFAGALREMPGPTLAYCRSGKRALMLWALSKPEGVDEKEILKRGQDAGFDMSHLFY